MFLKIVLKFTSCEIEEMMTTMRAVYLSAIRKIYRKINWFDVTNILFVLSSQQCHSFTKNTEQFIDSICL